MLADVPEDTGVDVLRENGQYVESLQTAVKNGEFSLDLMPSLITQIVKGHRWQRRYVRALQREASFDSFAEFVNAKMPEGLGASVEMIRKMCQDDDAALDAIEEGLRIQPGAPEGNRYAVGDNTIHYNIMNSRPKAQQGTSTEYALRRLRDDAPGLHARVIRGELTPHAAMVEAGFRKRMISIPVEDPERAARSICANASPEFLDELIEAIERNRTT